MDKVLEGKFPPPPSHCRQAMHDLISFILQADPEQRPTVRGIFEQQYVREGLKMFLEAVDRSSKINPETKKELEMHVSDIISSASPAKPQANPKDTTYEGPVKKLGGTFGRSWKVPSPPPPFSFGEAQEYMYPSVSNHMHRTQDRYLYLRNGELVICEKKGDLKSGKSLLVEQIKSVCRITASSAQKENVFALNITGLKATWLQPPSSV